MVNGDIVPVTCLEDSGTEIPVLRHSVIQNGECNMRVIGSVKIRGIVGQSVDCTFVRLYACLLSGNKVVDEKQQSLTPILCAVTDEAHEEMILPRAVIDRMRSVINTEISFSNQLSVQGVGVGQVTWKHETAGNSDEPAVSVVTRSGVDTGKELDSLSHQEKRSLSAEEETLGDSSKQIVDANEPPDCQVEFLQSESSRQELIKEEQSDESLRTYWKWLKSGKGNMFTQNGILMHRDRIFGHELSQMVVPDQRRSQVLKMAHDMAGHIHGKIL